MIVLDSSFIVGFLNQRDAHHTKSLSLMREFLDGRWGKGLLLEYVYLEVVTVLLTRAGLAIAVDAANRLLDAREIDFVPCSSLFAQTASRFMAQQQTKLSFADIAIAIVALKRADGLVLTFDEEFLKVPDIRWRAVAVRRWQRRVKEIYGELGNAARFKDR